MVNALSKAYELREYAVEQDKLSIISIYHGSVTGDINESIRNYETWSALYPHASSPRTNLANQETQIGRNDLAIEPAQQAVQLGPGETAAYVVLARAQMHVGQFEQARATCEKAISLKIDDASIHGLLVEMAFARRDEDAVDEQVAWSRGKPAEPFILLQKMISEFGRGKVRSGEALLADLTEKYRKQGLNERADRMQGAVPRMEVMLGRVEQARTQLRALPPLSGSTDIPVALALTGQIPQAEAILANEIKLRPNGTMVQNDRAPQIRAAIALNQNKPQDAIQGLQRSLPYDLHTYDIPTLRGLAYLAAKQPAQAEGEFHKIVDHPGLDPLSDHFALAHLGLARALAEETNYAASRVEYESFFTLFKDADLDLPVLLQARKEYAELPH
jgi:tetratricopeptide (TPR) repeat protein